MTFYGAPSARIIVISLRQGQNCMQMVDVSNKILSTAVMPVNEVDATWGLASAVVDHEWERLLLQ